MFPCQGQWTEEDYFALRDTNRIVELSDGRLVVPDVATDPHQYAVGRLFIAISNFVDQHRLGRVRVAPLRVRLWAGKIREPDVVFLSRQHSNRRAVEAWGVPDLAVEVISPRTETSSGTEQTDRRDKFSEYAQAGVAEYWLVDPGVPAIEVYVLRNGAYHLLSRWGEGEVARSELLAGFEVPVAAIVEPEEEAVE